MPGCVPGLMGGAPARETANPVSPVAKRARRGHDDGLSSVFSAMSRGALMTIAFDPVPCRPTSAAPAPARVHLVREPLDAVARSLALARAGRGWTVVVSAPGDREGANALVADIWDAGGTVRAFSPFGR